MIEPQPAYLELLNSGELKARGEIAYAHLERCDICPVNCHANRLAGKGGICQTLVLARVSSHFPHMGEEPPLTGWAGSGTIFFCGCNLRCQFCQNYEISQQPGGEEASPEQLAAMMLELQEMGCHNINLVSPSHVVPQILAAVLVAAQAGLRLPLVYNTGGYDSLAMLALLDGVIDIYMPDMKYASAQVALHYSKVRDYPAHSQAAVLEMHRQVEDLVIDGRGIARRGLLVRHLVLPNGLAGTEQIVTFLDREVSPDTYFNLMDQYHPCFHASQFPSLNRRITAAEYSQAVKAAHLAGLHRLDSRREPW